MNSKEERLLNARIVPPVGELTFVSEAILRLENGTPITVKGGNADDVVEDARRQWDITPKVKTLPPDDSLKPEAYEIEINPDGVLIGASASVGVRHALKTLRQLAETERGVAKSSYYFLPSVRIKDEPKLAFRGIHFCWFPETPAWEVEKQIRLAAYYKFNHIVLESWGVFRLKSFPEFIWEEFAVEQDEVKRLVKLADDLGVTIFPQVNLFGHASASRTAGGKHALLDFHPEYAPLFEPDGWTWCISNPETRKYLTDIVIEMHELFGNPPFFHIGCDEAFNAGSCTSCRRADYTALLKDHLLCFHNLLKQRGARPLMWHDMLVACEDERWKGYTAFGRKEGGLDELYRELPKDILICDWQYGYPEINGQPPEWPTLKFFKESGFDVLACPWLDQKGIASLGEFAVREGLSGMLETTWNFNHAGHMQSLFYSSARAAWGTSHQEQPGIRYFEFLNRHLREVGCDMKINKYIQTGRVQHQINLHDYVQV